MCAQYMKHGAVQHGPLSFGRSETMKHMWLIQVLFGSLRCTLAAVSTGESSYMQDNILGSLVGVRNQ